MSKSQAEKLSGYRIDPADILLPSLPPDSPEQGAIRDRLLTLLAQIGGPDDPLVDQVRRGLRIPAGGPVGEALTWVFRKGTTGEEMTQIGQQLVEQWLAHVQMPTLPPPPSAGSLAAFLAEHGLGWNEGEIVRLLLDWAVERRPDDLQAAQEHLQILIERATSSA